MPVPISQMLTVATYLLRKKLRGETRAPLVLMLEPLYRCNLSCAGCGKIQYPKNLLRRELSVDECMRAVDECGAPIVSIPGGEPLLHPQIDEIVRELVKRGKYVYLCTNALILEQNLDRFEPSRYLSFSVHLDGLAEDHDFSVCREGTFDKAYRAIERALERGFRVTTNSTFFDRTDPERTRAFFDAMTKLGVEGMTISPGYSYQKAPNQEGFLGRDRTRNLFRRLLHDRDPRWRFNHSPLFLEFLAGARDYDCTPWGNPTYGIFGWQKPCYLLQDGYEESFGDLVARTDWSRYGPRSGNPRCQDCMVHSGFEASAVNESFSSLRGLLAITRAMFRGPSIPEPAGEPLDAGSAGEEGVPEGAPARGHSAEATPELLRRAFEYRGDVTLTFSDGREIEGFVANLREKEIEFWPRGGDRSQTLPIFGLARISFTGRNAAEGKGWDLWLRKQEAKRAAAAAHR